MNISLPGEGGGGGKGKRKRKGEGRAIKEEGEGENRSRKVRKGKRERLQQLHWPSSAWSQNRTFGSELVDLLKSLDFFFFTVCWLSHLNYADFHFPHWKIKQPRENKRRVSGEQNFTKEHACSLPKSTYVQSNQLPIPGLGTQFLSCYLSRKVYNQGGYLIPITKLLLSAPSLLFRSPKASWFLCFLKFLLISHKEYYTLFPSVLMDSEVFQP